MASAFFTGDGAARMNTAADLVERCVGETLTYYSFPDVHWQKIMQPEAVALIKCARDSGHYRIASAGSPAV